MALDLAAILQAMKTHLAAVPTLRVQIGEPFNPPDDVTTAIYFLGWSPGQSSSLDAATDVWTLQVRVYERAGMSPADAERVELGIATAAAGIAAALAGGFTLGDTVRAVSWNGEEPGHAVRAQFGHVVISGTIMRVADFTVPLIVDDSATFAP